MDPLSIIAGTVGTADVAIRLSRFLKRTWRGSYDVDQYLQDIEGRVDNVRSITISITNITQAPEFIPSLNTSLDNAAAADDVKPLTKSWERLWQDTETTCRRTTKLLQKLEGLMRDIYGEEDPSVQYDAADEEVALDGSIPTTKEKGSSFGSFRVLRHSASSKISRVRMQLRRDSKAEELQDIKRDLDGSQVTLETCLSMINLGWNVKSHRVTVDLLKESKDEFIYFMKKLNTQLASLQPVKPVSLEVKNHVFQARAASPTFTGRESLLRHVSEAFELVLTIGGTNLTASPDTILPPTSFSQAETLIDRDDDNGEPAPPQTTFPSGRKQKRFVVVGLGGSGKTEFCCKFAEQNQQSYWGVFWIDASSHETAHHSYREVARALSVEQNPKAAMVSLAGLVHPWLLIIDNADDPKLDIEQYLPGGDRGCVLITSRRPSLRYLGNVGQGYCEFEKLEEFEASDLLLKQAHESQPWSQIARSMADKITKVLGYLPLALVCAGRAIAEGITTLQDYIEWFEDTWAAVQMQSKQAGGVIDETSKNVFAPYEAMLQSLASEDTLEAQDALDLLKVFSFLHYDGIAFEWLVQAAENPLPIEKRAAAEVTENSRRESEERGVIIKTMPKSWRRRFRDGLFYWVERYDTWVQQPSLPQVLQRDQDPTISFNRHRLRKCLVRLTQKSLVAERDRGGDKFFSMHPLVHKWVRERPYMRISERGLWCQAAVTMLNQSIPMPPLGQEKSGLRLRSQLVPHLDAARKFQKDLDHIVDEKRKQRPFSSFLLPPTSGMTRAKALQFAKFSRVYAENGLFHEARDLLETLKEYILGIFGMEDERTVQIMSALSMIYFMCSQTRDAFDLQSEALQACLKVFGPEHPRTLRVMTDLGYSEVNRGRYKEALKLHEDALTGMRKVLPADDPDIFVCIGNLGEVYNRYLQFDKAQRLQIQSVDGLTRVRGPTHADTLAAKSNLAQTYLEKANRYGQHVLLDATVLETHAEDLHKAYLLSIEVVEARRRDLGKESNLTLWGIFCLARVKAVLGQLTEAEDDMRSALAAGERNVGEYHLAVVAGKAHLARVLAAQDRHEEAQVMFMDVIAKNKYQKSARDEGEHPDQLTAVWYYAGSCQLSGKVEKAIELLEGISGGLHNIGAHRHPFWHMVKEKLLELYRLRDEKTGEMPHPPPSSSTPGVENPMKKAQTF